MFEITITPALSVLPVQHELFLDGTMLDVGQSGGGRPFPPSKFCIDIQQAIGQSAGGGPFPPTKFNTDAVFNVGQSASGGKPPPTK